MDADTAMRVRQLVYPMLTGWQHAKPAYRVQHGAHRRAPLDQVTHIEQRVQGRADRLYLVVEEAVVVAVPAAVHGVRQHKQHIYQHCLLARLGADRIVNATFMNALGRNAEHIKHPSAL